MKYKLAGILPEEIMIKLGPIGQNWPNMDVMIRKLLKIPDDRYYSVVIFGARGKVFIDLSRKLEEKSEKISKSNS